MMYDAKNFLKDFITRTLKNLDYIQKSEKQGEKVYEITQFVNSFLGLIVFPQQYGDGYIEDVEVCPILLKSLESSINENTYKKRKRQVFNDILYHLRNAIAHGQLDFKNENRKGEMEISGIKFTDVNPNDKEEKFIIELSIDQIKKIVKCIIQKFK